MFRLLLHCLLVLGCMPMLGFMPILAAPSYVHAQPRHPKLPLEQAMLQVQQNTHGKILSATTMVYGRGFLHRIKVLLPNGHIRTLSITTSASKNAGDPHIMHHTVESGSPP